MTQLKTKTRVHDCTQPAQGTCRSNSLPPVASGTGMLDLQRDAGNRTVSDWLQSGPLIQTKSNNGDGATNVAERQADTAAEQATDRRPAAPARALIVEDDARQLQPGQMRKSEFLSALKSSVCSAAEQSLRGTMWSTMGCPYIERWFNHFDNQPGARIERALLKYTPEAATATSARDYIPIVTQRVSRGIGEWRETGQVTGLPEEFAAGGEMPGMSVSGLMSGVLSGIGGAMSGLMSGIGSAVSSLASGIGGAVSSVGKMLFKRRDGETRETDDPEAIREQLGAGHPLDSDAKGRLQSVFGADFSGVRVHTDATAQGLSDQLNAHAFTIGSDIAFAPGEYQPGTVVGDALIAHELAHVVQQGGSSSFQPQRKETDSELDADADLSALGAMASLAGGLTVPQMKPRRRLGLSLQRCRSRGDQERQSQQQQPQQTPAPTGSEAGQQTAAQTGPAENWNFTPQDYSRLQSGQRALRIASDSAWFPAGLQQNLLNTLNFLLNPSRTPQGTAGVNVRDFYHGHVGIRKQRGSTLPQSVSSRRTTFDTALEQAKARAMGQSFNTPTQQQIGPLTQEMRSTLPRATDLLNETLRQPGVVVVYHTFEASGPNMQPGDPRRNYLVPLDTNTPAPYSPPDPRNASSWMDEYHAVFDFGFLIDRNGEVHIVPSTTSAEMSTITGRPETL